MQDGKFSFSWLKRKEKKHKYTAKRTSTPEVGSNGEFVHRYVMPASKREQWILDHYPENAEEMIFDKTQGVDTRDVASDPERRKKARVLMLISIAVALLLLLSYPIARLIGSQLIIGSVEVVGCDYYSKEELLEVSGLSMGDGLPVFDQNRVEEMTVAGLPYVESCNVSVELPNKLIFELIEANAVAYTKIANEYFALSDVMRVLERSENEANFKGLIYVDLPPIATAIVGEIITLEDDKSHDFLVEFLALLNESELSGRVGRIFFDEKFSIVLVVDERFKVRFGSPKEHNYKFAIINALIKDNSESADYGIIDVTVPQKSGFTPQSTLDFNSRE